MPLAFLLDEHLRGPLWQAVLRHNLHSERKLDAVRVGDPQDLPLGATDAAILIWAEREGRLLLTEDCHTMSKHLDGHLAAGGRSPGILMVRRGARIRDLLETLLLIAYAAEPGDFANSVIYVP